MACACTKKQKWVAMRPDGSSMVYLTESQAAADVRRNGGSYRVVGQ